MSDSMFSMEVEGLEELQESFQNMIHKYPDRAGELLVKQAKELRKDVVKMVKNDTDSDGKSKRSLAKAKEYKIGKVQGLNDQQYIEVSARAPHFHLVENGHQIVTPRTRTVQRKDGSKEKVKLANGGASKGYVVGYHFMDRASKKRRIEIPKALESTIDKLLKEEGLL